MAACLVHTLPTFQQKDGQVVKARLLRQQDISSSCACCTSAAVPQLEVVAAQNLQVLFLTAFNGSHVATQHIATCARLTQCDQISSSASDNSSCKSSAVTTHLPAFLLVTAAGGDVQLCYSSTGSGYQGQGHNSCAGQLSSCCGRSAAVCICAQYLAGRLLQQQCTAVLERAAAAVGVCKLYTQVPVVTTLVPIVCFAPHRVCPANTVRVVMHAVGSAVT